MIFCEGEKVYLREVDLNDLELIVKWKNDYLLKKMSIGLTTEINHKNQSKDILRSKNNKNELYYIIALKESNQPIGYIRINWMGNTNYFAWLRFGLGEERGKGYAKDALKSLINKLFEGKTHRIDAEVYEYNENSLGLLKKLGFIEEGIRREAYYDGKNFIDVITLGLLNKKNQNNQLFD